MKTINLNLIAITILAATAFIACEKDDLAIDKSYVEEASLQDQKSLISDQEAAIDAGILKNQAGNENESISPSPGTEGDSNSVVARGSTPFTIYLVDKHNISCHGGSDGSAEVGVTGAIGDVKFKWSNGQTGRFLENVEAGPYSLVATDGFTTAEFMVIFLEPSPLSVELIESEAETCVSSGSAVVTGVGGTLPYSYEWPTGITLAGCPLTAGEHTVTVTDGGGCKALLTIIIESEIDKPEFKFKSVELLTCSRKQVSLSIVPESLDSDWTYKWIAEGGVDFVLVTASIPPKAVVDKPGFYTMRVTDTRTGCVTEKTIEVKQVRPLLLFAGFAGEDKTISMFNQATLSMGSFPRSIIRYQWAPASKIDDIPNKPTVKTVRLLNSTTFYLEIEDEFGCIYYDDVKVNVIKPLPYEGIESKVKGGS